MLAFIVWEKVLGVLGMWTAGRGSLLEVPEDAALQSAVGDLGVRLAVVFLAH